MGRRQKILDFCNEPKSLTDILDHLALRDRENLMNNYINPLITAGELAMTEPTIPTSRNQQYVTIKKGTENEK